MAWGKHFFQRMFKKFFGAKPPSPPNPDERPQCARCKAHGCCIGKGCVENCKCRHYRVTWDVFDDDIPP